MDPEISSCPDSPDRDPSLEFCNDWEEPRDLLLKAGFKSRIFKKGSKQFLAEKKIPRICRVLSF